MTIKVEVIPWQSKAGQFGVVVQRDAKAEADFVGSRTEAEREARRKRDKEAHREPAEVPNSKALRRRAPR